MQTLLLMSHIGSNSSLLFDNLKQHSIIDGFKTNIVYENIESIQLLRSNLHKCENAASIWMDEILHNYRFTNKSLSRLCKLVFLFGEPRSSLEQICKIYNHNEGLLYYQFRLQGMLEYIARTPGSLIMTWPRLLLNGQKVLENWLELREPLPPIQEPPLVASSLPLELLKEAEVIYDRLMFQLETLEKRFK